LARLQRKGKNNVFTKLKETLNRDILGMGCYAILFIIQCASDCLPIDVESKVCKMFSFFHIYTVRVENLKEYCDFADVQYKDLLSFKNKVAFCFSVFPAIERIISILDGLKSYFLPQNNCPNALKIFFENESALLWL